MCPGHFSTIAVGISCIVDEDAEGDAGDTGDEYAEGAEGDDNNALSDKDEEEDDEEEDDVDEDDEEEDDVDEDDEEEDDEEEDEVFSGGSGFFFGKSFAIVRTLCFAEPYQTADRGR